MAEEIILERCIVCAWTACDIDHKKDKKTMKFIEACRKVHLYRFGYENSIYKSCKKDIIINCSIHGNFKQNANHHKKGSACKICSGKCTKTAQKNFIKRVEALGGNVTGKYVNSNTPVECICKEDHKCNPRPSDVSQDVNICRICTIGTFENAKYNFEKNIKLQKGIILGEYERYDKPVKCLCEKKHDCNPVPTRIQQGGKMCNICFPDPHDPDISKINFEKNINNLGGIVKGDYINSNIPVECICKEDHKCNPTPADIQQGHGMCRICAKNDFKTAEKNFKDGISRLGGRVIGIYKGKDIPVECICKEDHKCFPIPSSIRDGFGMCRVCSKQDPITAEANFRYRISELKGEVKGSYINVHTQVECLCSQGHICNPTPANISQGHGMCTTCSQNGYSQAQISWLNYIQSEEKINILHAENGGEFRIGKYKVDGYCKETNTVYEFHGDFWHGNPKFYEHTDTNPVNKKSFGQLLKATLHKEMSIRKKGYNYKCIWECEWNLMRN